MNSRIPKALDLRDQGYSYSYISSKTGVSLSTLHYWLKDRPYTPNEYTKKKIISGRGTSSKNKKLQAERLKLSSEENALRDIGTITKRDLHMVGLGIWLGEGSKTTKQIRLANSNPDIIRFWVQWLQSTCEFTPEQITIRMHLYADSDEKQCQEFWQNVTSLPESSFLGSVRDTRENKNILKHGKLPHGTVHIMTRALGDKSKGIAMYHRLSGWISAIINRHAGVV